MRQFLVAIAGLLVASRALAQDHRPNEDEMFGGKPETPQASPPASAAPPTGGAPPTGAAPPAGTNPAAATEAQAPAPPSSSPVDSRDEAVLGGHENQMFTEEAAPSDPLRIGGQLYLRAQTTGLAGQHPGNFSFSTPTLADVYFDARPNDRVRGFILGRMVYDPTLPTSSSTVGATTPSATGGTSGSGSLSSLFGQQSRTPNLFLDQLWLRFDIAHTVFVTAGKQHVRWGTGHFWSPTDFLHFQYRNPLDIFDARTGTTMVKLHLPIESKAWNFYAYGITEAPDATQTIGKIAGAARAEFVVDAAEFGVGAFVRRDQDPRLAGDVSFGIGDFDLYGEIALKNASEIDRVRLNPDASFTPPGGATQDELLTSLKSAVDVLYPVHRDHDYRPQVVGGLSYARKYNDNDTFTVGAEYFYNAFGYSNPDAYPGLVLPRTNALDQPAPFFYLGRHYGALYVTFPSPFKLDLHTFTLSTLGNLSDHSFITRFDYSYVLLTHLRFEAFASARYGNSEGEFRFGVNSPLFHLSPAVCDLGVALRLAI
ncbi:MAG TPA: hypothetical protein VHU80_20530 [Polyangiaceae bacterium]|nr:hypothetical protein [Polyangiaceae bacterium]